MLCLSVSRSLSVSSSNWKWKGLVEPDQRAGEVRRRFSELGTDFISRGLLAPPHLFLSPSTCPQVHKSTCPQVHMSTCPQVHISTSPHVHMSSSTLFNSFLFQPLPSTVCSPHTLCIIIVLCRCAVDHSLWDHIVVLSTALCVHCSVLFPPGC